MILEAVAWGIGVAAFIVLLLLFVNWGTINEWGREFILPVAVLTPVVFIVVTIFVYGFLCSEKQVEDCIIEHTVKFDGIEYIQPDDMRECED